MPEDALRDFIASMGLLVELWEIIFTSFVKRGYDETKALRHTEALVTATLKATLGFNPSQKEGN